MSQKALLRPLILASTSRSRAMLLERLGLPFSTHDPGVDETDIAGESPRDRAVRLAKAKAEAAAGRFPEAVVIGGDQVSAARDTILHKPGNAARCRELLEFLSGSQALFHSACTVRCVASGLQLSHTDLTTVSLRSLSAEEMDRYIAREPSFECAGGFKAEGLGITLFERMESRDPTAIIGLPLIWLSGALRTAGYDLP
jgi:septum formation protein